MWLKHFVMLLHVWNMIQWLWLLDGCLQTPVLEICIFLAYVAHLISSSSSSSSSSVICQTTGPKPLPKLFLHIVRSRAFSFNWQHPLLSLKSSSSFLRLLPRLLVTSIWPFIFPSITCCRRQFLRKFCSEYLVRNVINFEIYDIGMITAKYLKLQYM